MKFITLSDGHSVNVDNITFVTPLSGNNGSMTFTIVFAGDARLALKYDGYKAVPAQEARALADRKMVTENSK